jgi:multiple sugar transport system substrate-binding protein
MSADDVPDDADARPSPVPTGPAATRGVNRRDVIKGSVATAILSLSASTMLSLRQPAPLHVVLGDDGSGAFDFLFDAWSKRTGIGVVYERAGSHAPRQRRKMLEWIHPTDDRDHVGDLLGVDVVHMPEFIAAGHLAKIGRDLIAEANGARTSDEPLRFDRFVEPALTSCREPGGAEGVHYGVPLTTNVGVLFGNPAVPAKREIRTLRDLATAGNLTWAAQLPEQLPPELLGNGSEALICNAFEHARALHDQIDGDDIIGDDGRPSGDPERWNEVFGKLREAARKGRLKRAPDEEKTAETFNGRGATFMRNWPSSRTAGRRSPVPAQMIAFAGATIGGQNLAINVNSRRQVDALRLAAFLTSREAQKILALHGYAPTLQQLYDRQEDELFRILPHLPTVNDALAWGRHRPRIPRYAEFSGTVCTDVIAALRPRNWTPVTAARLEVWRSFFPTT